MHTYIFAQTKHPPKSLRIARHYCLQTRPVAALQRSNNLLIRQRGFVQQLGYMRCYIRHQLHRFDRAARV